MKARLVKPVKHDLSSRSSVFTPVSPISKTKILSGKLSGKILPDTGILPDSGILLDTSIRIRYIPRAYTTKHVARMFYFQRRTRIWSNQSQTFQIFVFRKQKIIFSQRNRACFYYKIGNIKRWCTTANIERSITFRANQPIVKKKMFLSHDRPTLKMSDQARFYIGSSTPTFHISIWISTLLTWLITFIIQGIVQFYN